MARKMKDSGIEWIGEIPEGWETINPKALFTQRKDRASKGERQLTSSQQYGILYQDEYMELTGSKVVTVEKDFDILKHVEAGDFVISMRSFQGGLEYSTNSGAISSAYVMLVPNLELVYPRFYRWLLKSSVYIDALQRTTNMVRDGQAMRYSNFAQVRLFTLPLDEQKSRADFLDLECSSIDKILFKTRSSIEEHKKLKQAVITQAVTKGVRGEREMKDSGVEWAGLVPHHWGVAKIGSIGQTSSGATPLRSKEASFFDDATIRWVRTLDLNDGLVYDSSEKITELALASSACSIMPKGTVCVAMYGGAGTIGKCGLLMSDCATNQAVCSIVCNREIVSPIFLLMQLLALKSYWMKYAVGTRKDPNISQDIVARMKILIPPLDEQKEITDHLDAKCAEIDGLIAKKEQLVKELESYKKSLIYEVVTGKREV
jgi:type I restriction enzyme S subunit